MPAIFVRLRPLTFDRLRRVAAHKRRRPQDQAAVIIEQTLDGDGRPDASRVDLVGAVRSHDEADR